MVIASSIDPFLCPGHHDGCLTRVSLSNPSKYPERIALLFTPVCRGKIGTGKIATWGSVPASKCLNVVCYLAYVKNGEKNVPGTGRCAACD